MSNKAIVYTKTVCPTCQHLKKGLQHVPVDLTFEYRNIEEKPEWAAEHAELGYSAVPVTVFPDGDVLVGFEMGEFQEKFGL